MSHDLDVIARHANVSIASVSRALRGVPGVSPATRARILDVAASLGYEVSPNASRLATGGTHTIGVVAPYVNRWFFGQVITGVENILQASGFDLLLYNIGSSVARTRFFTELPLKRRVDGVIVVSVPLDEAEVEKLSTLQVPVGVVGATVEPFACVRIDDVAAARRGTRHLASLGHREIAMIGGDLNAPMYFIPPVERRRGYLEALAGAGIEYDPTFDVACDYTVAGGERAMVQLLNGRRRPTAVFAQSDEMAFGAIRALIRAGLRVPDDMSIVGFDNHEMADVLDITTIEQPVVQQGATVAQMLLDLLAADEDPAGKVTVLPTHLVVRGSAARVRGTLGTPLAPVGAPSLGDAPTLGDDQSAPTWVEESATE